MLSHGYILSPPENNSDYLVTDWSEVCTYADAHKCVLSYYFHWFLNSLWNPKWNFVIEVLRVYMLRMTS